jgi:hypothetical protein
MAARLGNVIYWTCCGVTALWLTFAIANAYGPIAVADQCDEDRLRQPALVPLHCCTAVRRG